MKVITIFLSLVILSFSVAPCCAAEDDCSGEINPCEAAAHHPDGNDMPDLPCLPFFSCGTCAVLAITISMYVIIFFAFIYFFFPSEWDVTSKSKLLSNFKNLKEKNDKGYVMPFFSLLIGLLVSLINGLTLSVSAFTTLGFGNIPTKGFARYLTII